VVLLHHQTLADTANPIRRPPLLKSTSIKTLRLPVIVIFTGLYDIPYATLPALTADQTFIIRLLDTDSVTEWGSVVPYPYSGFKNG